MPVFIGHAEAVFIETTRQIDEAEAREALNNFPGVVVVDHRESGGMLAQQECAGEDAVYVSRLRFDPPLLPGLVFGVSDNLRKGGKP